jgi:hypothetical protein
VTTWPQSPTEYRAQLARQQMMIDKLYDQVQRDCIGNEWAKEFILSTYARLNAGLSLTDKQAVKLEELFERY